jgi:hypothetical protein
MRKIREFNLRLPFKELRLRARRALDLDALGIDDAAFSEWIASLEKTASPAVVFDTFGPDSEETAALSPIPGLGHTVGLASLGADVAGWVDERRTESAEKGELAELLAGQALDRCIKFVLNLIKDDVEEDRCELSPIQPIEDGEQLAFLIEKLDGGKIDLSLDAGHLRPGWSTAFCVSWIAKKGRPGKKKKPRAGARRR